MIELERHIEILLLDNDCVIVPDLGGFMAHHIEASYSGEDSLFLPPLRTLGFNPKLKLNDSLLVQSYIEAYDMSYPEAQRRIEEEVNELKKHLSNEGFYTLKGIGVLSLNSEGTYSFEPCQAGILTPELYALSSFEMKRLPDASSQETVGNLFDSETKPSSIGNAEQSVCNVDETADNEYDDDENKFVRIRLSWIRNIAAVAAAVIAFFAISPTVSNSNPSEVTYGDMGGRYFWSIVEAATSSEDAKNYVATPVVVEDSANVAPLKNVIYSDTMAVEPAQKEVAKKEELPAVSPESNDKYCLVLASMITKKNANAFVEQLHKNGFDKAAVYIKNDTVRVIYGSYETETAAYNDLKRLSRNADFEQAWVYKKK